MFASDGVSHSQQIISMHICTFPSDFRSLFFPDEAINGSHPRFKTLTRNIRERRGEKIMINVPIFPDTNTPTPFMEDLPPESSNVR